MEEKKEEPVQYKKADKKLEQKLQEQSNNFWNKLSNEEKKALSEYSDVHYGITNRYLRNALYDDDDIELDNTKERIRHLDKVLKNNKIGEDVILYRGVSFEEFEYWKKSDFINTYKSTSLYKGVTDTFDEIYKIKIYAPKKTKGYYIGKNSECPEESEFLLHRNQKYRILNTEDTMLEVKIYE